MKELVSLICTLKNEERTVQAWLDSVVNQTRAPDELIIVDGGSKDKTVDIIRNYGSKIKIRLFVCPNSNIAQGRNIAVRNCSYDIVASTDAGCTLDPKWLENIVNPFETSSDVDVVSGFYRPWHQNEFEEIASCLTFPQIDKVDPDKFLPSSRSVAFKKSAWKKVNGYPEWLDTAEDTLFDLNLRKAGLKFVFAKNAIVYWKVRANAGQIFSQNYNYAKGDGLAFLFPFRYFSLGLITILAVFLCIESFYRMYIWPIFFLLVFSIAWFQYFRNLKRFTARRIITASQIILAVFSGAISGYFVGFVLGKMNRQIGNSPSEVQETVNSQMTRT